MKPSPAVRDLHAPDSPGRTVPPAPETLEDTGLGDQAVIDLIVKTLYVGGVRTGQELAESLKLPFVIVDELLMQLQQRLFIETRGTRWPGRGGYEFALSAAGRERAREAFESSTYVGPAPVPLEVYGEWIRKQSVMNVRVPPKVMRGALSDLVIDEDQLETLGPAINSARSMFLYGAPGNGKTAIAERVATMTAGALFIPYAIDVDGQTVQLFDPVYHTPVSEPEPFGGQAEDWLPDVPTHDIRFVEVKRPTVFVGGELMLHQLDLQYDSISKFYKAPFQLKAAGGVLILDDFGRQRIEPRELLNRWVVPLERNIDFLTLHTGVKFPIPFDCRLIFATNLDPSELVEEAFLRRINYKIRIDDPSESGYQRILEDVCRARGIEFTPEATRFIFGSYYKRFDIHPRACHPRDIVNHIEDIARYRGMEATLSTALLDQACEIYFLVMEPGAMAAIQQKHGSTGASR